MSNGEKILPEHHVQQELCATRPMYRQGRKLTAIKVYTINNESQHLIIYRVPKINLINELKAECMKFGNIKKITVVSKYQTEIFTECYHVQYERIQSARIAKRFLDNKSFYGELLHVCYAPEYETLIETKQKLLQRQKDVTSRLVPGPTLLEYANVQENDKQVDRKRKHPALPITEKRLKLENENIWNNIPNELDPRLDNNDKINIGFKKHYQIPKSYLREVESTSEICNAPSEGSSRSSNIRTTLLPTPVIKKYEHCSNKRIVFRNKK